ncbi:MAG: glycosyltransferase family 4 protein [Anaerolineae bacterium]
MRITLDVSPAVNGKAGLGRYAESLAAALPSDRLELFANVTPSGRWPASLDYLPRRAVRAGYKPWRMAVLLAQMAGIGWDRWIAPGELFHATEHLLLPLRHTPTVLTVHDLIFRRYPEHHKRLNYWYLNLAMPLYVRRADHINTISEHSKRDLIDLYGLAAAKISVIYEAAAPHFCPQPPDRVEAVRRAYRLPERYILTVGTIEPRKNLDRLVAAFAQLRRTDPDLRLVVVGAEGWLTEGFHRAVADHAQAEAVIRPGYIPDADLPAVYAGAQVAVTASLVEGFGLPVLEAMACGTPVACSETTSLGEIAGDAAHTFDPADTQAIAAALQTILGDADYRTVLRERGLRHAARFSWARTAEQTLAVYKEILR